MLILKVFVILALYGLSDAQTEHLDQRTFERFFVEDGNKVLDGEPGSAPSVQAPRRTRSGGIDRHWRRRAR